MKVKCDDMCNVSTKIIDMLYVLSKYKISWDEMIPPDSNRKDLKDHTDGSAFQTEFLKKGNKEKQRECESWLGWHK